MKKIVCFLALIAIVSCGGTEKDPKTNDRGEFNPPGNLQTITQDGKIVLTWVGANAEDDFKGYHVFGIQSTLSDLLTAAPVSFPSSPDLQTKQESIPRCKDNSAFFEKFGFPATDEECESSEIVEEETDSEDASPALAANLGSYVLAEDDSSDSDEQEDLTIDFNLACSGSDQTVADGSLSLAATDGKTLGRVFCDVEKVFSARDDAGTAQMAAVESGKTYVFFVVAVKGSDKNEISWISNVVEDTPAKQIYSDTLSLEKEKYAKFDLDITDFTAITTPTAQSCTASACKLTTPNSESAETSIYISRDTISTYPQRLTISTSSSGKIKIQPRGAEVWTDPRDDTTQPRKPGDAAVTTYPDAGTKFPIYGDQVFDLEITKDSSTKYYGKVVIRNVSYESNATDAKASLEVTIVVQNKAGTVHYLQ